MQGRIIKQWKLLMSLEVYLRDDVLHFVNQYMPYLITF